MDASPLFASIWLELPGARVARGRRSAGPTGHGEGWRVGGSAMSEGTSRADAAAGAPAAGAAAPRTCTCLPGRKAKADKEERAAKAKAEEAADGAESASAGPETSAAKAKAKGAESIQRSETPRAAPKPGMLTHKTFNVAAFGVLLITALLYALFW